MAWNNPGGGGPWGGGGGGRGPWGGGGPGGGNSGQPPDPEEMLRKAQAWLKNLLPGGGGGFGSGKVVILGVIVVVAIWLLTGFYRVNSDEQGVVLRFGEWSRTTEPGLHYHLPYPVETALTPGVTKINRIQLGFRSVGQGRGESSREVPDESLMLTGDENIVDINWSVFWRIKDAGKYLFNIRYPEQTVKMAAESVMREVIGQTPIQVAFTRGRTEITRRNREKLQELLDSYNAGIRITQVQVMKVDPPQPVIDAFNDVQRAKADRQRLRNEAEAYRNEIIPKARGEAEQIIQEAEGYREQVVDDATGDANRFKSVLEAYATAPNVTGRRLYLETMEDVFGRVNKVLVDSGVNGGRGGQGVVPYLPLPELQKRMKSRAGSGQGGGQ